MLCVRGRRNIETVSDAWRHGIYDSGREEGNRVGPARCRFQNAYLSCVSVYNKEFIHIIHHIDAAGLRDGFASLEGYI